MNFSQEQPQESGFYWYRPGNSSGDYIVEVTMSSTGMLEQHKTDVSGSRRYAFECKGQWSERIKHPDETGYSTDKEGEK